MNLAKVGLGMLLFYSITSFGETAFQEGQLIIRLTEKEKVTGIKDLPGVSEVQILMEDLNIYLVKFKSQVMSAKNSLSTFKDRPEIQWAQLDHFVTTRELPNDPQFSVQWNLLSPSHVDIRATEAWEISTGGIDKRGNEIVVAIVDGGVDVEHNDLKENIWLNRKEIPNNGIDDDNNGYIDDINGWNAIKDNSQITPDKHATHIAGIIGAKSNNGYMIAGLNWNVKIMTIDRNNATSILLKAYAYVLRNKKLWLESRGENGADVVATNSSFGVDYGRCTEGSFPAWNDIYNEMGKVGILSVAATANLNIDIDEKGDVPTGCDSPYLIAVTNTTEVDKKYDLAAYGKINVDLGAPGTNIWSTITNNDIACWTGTSMASPHVAGAIALIHAAASLEFTDYYMEHPAEAALKIKNILLTSVDKIPDLKERSVSEGRLNLGRAVQLASEYHEAPEDHSKNLSGNYPTRK